MIRETDSLVTLLTFCGTAALSCESVEELKEEDIFCEILDKENFPLDDLWARECGCRCSWERLDDVSALRERERWMFVCVCEEEEREGGVTEEEERFSSEAGVRMR